MMPDKNIKLKRVTLTYEILMAADDESEHLGLERIARECESGDWSGRSIGSKEEILVGKKKCQAACDDHATDFEFFFPEEDS